MKPKKWLILYPKKVTQEFSKERILELLLENRGASRPQGQIALAKDQVDPELAGIATQSLAAAIGLIQKAIRHEKKIIIYGDYDVDGLTATAVLWEALWRQGAKVLPFIPDRIRDGYGINPKTIRRLKKQHPDLELIITVDNGIGAHEAVALAHDLGIQIIISDHHLAPNYLPEAEAIIHSPQLAGVGVAWFLAREFGYQDLDLVALGTVADLLPLQGINHQLVKLGLKELADTRRVGLRELMTRAGLKNKEELSSWEISFILAPRLNAVGRLAQAIDGLRLLCADYFPQKEQLAIELASRLEQINNQRQDLMNQSFEDAQKKVGSRLKKILFAADESYHQGIIGLVAGKLVEKFYRPAIVVWRGERYSKGSARSIPGCNIVELIKAAEDLLVDLGGHPMAAGFTIETENIEKFAQRIEQIAESVIEPESLIPQLKIDFEIDFSLVNKDFYQLIRGLAPFGFGNPEPTFLIRQARVVNLRVMGKQEQHLKLWLDDPQTPLVERLVAEAIGFGWGEWSNRLLPGDLVDVVFNLGLNRWNGRETLQLKIKDLKPSTTPGVA